MNSSGSKLQTKVAEMRRVFDESFAALQPDDRREIEHMLAIEIAGERFAVRVNDISGLKMAKSKILGVPSSVPELLGITGVRGIVVPVFSLAALLGIGVNDNQSRWLVLCGERQSPIALALERVEGHIEVLAGEIYAGETDQTRRHIKETVRDGAVLRGVIDIAQLVENIKARGATGPAKQKKES
jgi:chemotaxis signal transduction protein